MNNADASYVPNTMNSQPAICQCSIKKTLLILKLKLKFAAKPEGPIDGVKNLKEDDEKK